MTTNSAPATTEHMTKLAAKLCNTCGSLDVNHDCTSVLLIRARWLILHYAHFFNETDKQEAGPLVEQIGLLLARRLEVGA